jgi:hypothetical protein
VFEIVRWRAFSPTKKRLGITQNLERDNPNQNRKYKVVNCASQKSHAALLGTLPDNHVDIRGGLLGVDSG